MKRERPEGCATEPAAVIPLHNRRRAEIVSVLRALGDDSRLEIYRLIAGQPEPICVCDIVDRFDLSQPTVSHHLRVLREAGLIVASRRGNWAFYEIDRDGLAVARKSLDQLVPAELTLV